MPMPNQWIIQPQNNHRPKAAFNRIRTLDEMEEIEVGCFSAEATDYGYSYKLIVCLRVKIM